MRRKKKKRREKKSDLKDLLLIMIGCSSNTVYLKVKDLRSMSKFPPYMCPSLESLLYI